MEVYSHLDENIEMFREEIASYAEQAETMDLPYWVFAKDSNPVGIFVVGEEPIQLLASPGMHAYYPLSYSFGFTFKKDVFNPRRIHACNPDTKEKKIALS